MFWNKEDPVHFERFLITASLFDVVFTSDMACIAHYKRALGHNNVHVLPFACQPAVHHPLEQTQRLPMASFAGSYYLRYPHRTRDLRSVLDAVRQLMSVDIFDRYFQSADTNYRFPPEYNSMVKGTLQVAEMHRAYKSYAFGINMNTVKQSASMFARRVFELLGSGTVVLSNESVGVRGFFGDVVLCSDSTPDLVQRLAPLVHDEVQRARQALAGVRAVMQQHTYAHRLDAIAHRVLGKVGFLQPLPPILILANADTLEQVAALVKHALHQSHKDWRMVLAVPAAIHSQAVAFSQDARVSVLPWDALQGLSLFTVAQRLAWDDPNCEPAHWVSGWLAQDYYGPNYLLDMALATRYTQASVLGKAAQFVWRDASAHLLDMAQAYRPARALAARCAMTKADVVANEPAQDWLLALAQRTYDNTDAVALDVFSYCCDGAAHPSVARVVDGAPMDMGLDLDELMAQADALAAAPVLSSTVPAWSAAQLAEAFGPWPDNATKAALDDFGWLLVSELPDDQTKDVWCTRIVSAAQLRAIGVWRFHVVASGGQPLQLLVQCMGIDVDGRPLLSQAFECNQNQQLTLPFGSRSLRLGWRFTSSGTARVKELVLGWRV
ncbi:MAG: glycosyltransferase [Rhodoferax sp.]|nr:glycosyltransferase [Rhodoferax sp.]